MRDDNLIHVPLPGIFTGPELMEAFRNAASFQEGEKTKWEYGQAEFTPGCYVGGHHYYRVFARPVFRNVPTPFQQRVLGQREKWERRNSALTLADSDVAVFLTTHTTDYEVCAERMSVHAFMGVRVDLRAGEMYVHTDNVDHPAFRPYRASFERIRANFLTNMVFLAKQHPSIQHEREQEVAVYYQNRVIAQEEARL